MVTRRKFRDTRFDQNVKYLDEVRETVEIPMFLMELSAKQVEQQMGMGAIPRRKLMVTSQIFLRSPVYWPRLARTNAYLPC